MRFVAFPVTEKTSSYNIMFSCHVRSNGMHKQHWAVLPCLKKVVI